MRSTLLLSVCLFVVVFVPQAHAVPLPDSGQILQEQKQLPKKLPQQLPEPEEKAAQSTPTANEGLRVTIARFTFSGFEGAVTEAELQTIVKPALGQTLSLNQLNDLVQKITNYLRNKGYFLARAYLPAQEINEGVVQIVIIAGQVEGSPELRLTPDMRVREQVLAKIAVAGAPSGQGLHRQHLERSLLLMNDLPGISANSILEKGQSAGTTHVIIEAQEGPLFNGLFSMNNFGNRFNGEMQGILQVAANDPSGIGDQLSANLTVAERLQNGTVSYNLPLGATGLKGGISYTGLRYSLGKEFKSLDAKGTANTLATQLSYPIVRSRRFSLWQGLNYEYRKLEDETSGVVTSQRKLHVGSAITTVNYFDNFAGGGLSNLLIQINVGDLNYGLAAQEAADAVTADSAGSFAKLTYSLSRLQRLPQNFTFFAAISGQLASKNLDSSEKFILGGPSGVRAYPVGEASGDEGHRLSTELRYDLPKKILSSNLQCVAFFDVGRVTLHNSTWTNSITTATGDNRYTLAGGGFGVTLDKPDKYSIRASYARAIGNNPGRSVSGNNADNKDENQQFWLQAIWWF